MSARLERLLENRYRTPEARRAEPFHDAWLTHADQPREIRLAHAIGTRWLGARLDPDPDERLIGRLALESIVTWSSAQGVAFDQPRWEEEHARASANRKTYLEEMRCTWEGESTYDLIWAGVSEEERAVCRAQSVIAPGCHASPLHVRLATEGTDGLRTRVRESQSRNLALPGTEPSAWYEALLILLDYVDRFAEACAEAAEREAARRTEEKTRVEWLSVAARCRRVPRRPATGFHDALQAYWFSSILHGVDSPGRFDQDLGLWLEEDLRQGILTCEEARELVDEIWIKFDRHRAWSLTLSGQKPEGGDATNELTWMALDAMRRLRLEAPNVSLRVHEGTPEELLHQACALLAEGHSMPALVNDTPVIASMRERKIASEHARDYTLVGCTQVVSRGRCAGCYEDLVVNALKCLELTLHDGVDPATGLRMGPATGPPEALDTYEDFEKACLTQLDHMIETTTRMVNRQLTIAAKQFPDLYKSLLIEGCLERGKDYRRGGPLYAEGLADVLGITNFGDSLLAVRTLVYDQNRLTLAAFAEILDRNWRGEELLRLECLNGISKFGNDDEDADACTLRVFHHINEGFRRCRKVYGNRFGIDVVGWTGSVVYGQQTGATPDGRRAGTPLCDSVGASQGRDKNGVTPLLHSVAKLPHDQTHGILALNLKFGGGTFSGRDGVRKLTNLIDAAFSQGLQQMQINVVDAHTLRAAQQRPEEYESLVVRIGGFSTYFNWLSRAHQDDIIARTEHQA